MIVLRVLWGLVCFYVSFVASLPSALLIAHWCGNDKLSTELGMLWFKLLFPWE